MRSSSRKKASDQLAHWDAGNRAKRSGSPVCPGIDSSLGLALVAAVFTGWAALEVAPQLGGPGITCDELYHAYQGKRLIAALQTQGWEFFLPHRIRQNFPYGDVDNPPFHPPLGHWLIGVVHALFDFYPQDVQAVSIISARFAGPVVLCCLLVIVGGSVARLEGRLLGVLGAWACAAMPRLFGHAHLAGLDLLTATTCLGGALTAVSVFGIGQAVQSHPQLTIRWGQVILTGLVLGLAMLTRFHGFLLVAPVVLWLLVAGGVKGLLVAAVCGAVALATFTAGWPWLWLNPVLNLWRFAVSSANRLPLHVYYFGQAWNDVDVPWHYPLVVFVTTVPLPLLILGLVGLMVRSCELLAQARQYPAQRWLALSRVSRTYEAMILLQLFFWVAIFAWPGIPVYDGERLFLVLYPLWAFPVVWGAKWLYEHAPFLGPRSWLATTAVVILALLSIVGHLLYRPVYLSYYNALVGGIRGAARLGLEVNYWGDAVTDAVVKRACQLVDRAQAKEAGLQPILFAPNLAPFQSAGLNMVFRVDEACGAEIIGWDPAWRLPPPGCRVAILYHRRADWHAVPEFLKEGRVVYEFSLQGVWLARVVALADDSTRQSIPASRRASGAADGSPS
ncbi:MAG: hypothetical protein NZ899_08990 [Thermoguttaceae bacterium]|nr:hypothetical protein [Thermoguttaceae bacterium]MDW8079901.1 hypothetical protein [Thermoguttaceae bacterium]